MVPEHMSVLHFNLADIAENQVLGGKVKTLLTPEKLGKDNPSQKFAHGDFKPGEGLRAHLHPESSEIYFVVKGDGTVFLGESLTDKRIRAGDILFIPPRTIHAVKNTGKEILEIAFFLVPGSESSKEA